MKFSEPKRRKEAMCCRRMNVEEDRINNLPDDLLHKILSFISIDDAIKTSFLSRRWRYLWTSIPHLNFLNEFLPYRRHYSDFVANALSRLNNQLHLSSFNLISCYSSLSPDLVKRIVNYAASHNVQQLTIKAFQSVAPATWELPALTTLHLHGIILSNMMFKHHTTDHKCLDLISKCINLKNFTLSEFQFEFKERRKVLDIFHPQLSTLTINDTYSVGVDVFNVVTPRLKKLKLKSFCYAKYMISAPQLTSLVVRGSQPVELSIEGFPVLDKAKLHIFRPDLTMAHKIGRLLQQLHTAKFLKLHLEFLELLSSSTERIPHQSCVVPNFNISKFSRSQNGWVYLEAQEKVVTMNDDEFKSQDTCQGAIFAIVSYEEIEVMSKLVSAKKPIEHLRFLVATTCPKRKRGKVQQQVKKPWLQSKVEMQGHFGEIMARIEQEKIDGLLIDKFPILETRDMISCLQCIAGLLTELPASKGSALQATFSSVCEEAAIVIDDMMDRLRKPPPSRPRKPKLNHVP